MKPDVKAALAVAAQARLPFLLWGGPGIGKTSFIYQLGQKLGYHTEVFIGSIHEPSDINGLPVLNGHGVSFALPRFMRALQEATTGAMLVLDELTTCAPAMQAALLRVVLERRVGDEYLGDHVAIAAAANDVDQAAGGQELALPLTNRLIHIMWPAEIGVWTEGLMRGSWDGDRVPRVPDDWALAETAIRPVVAAFLRARPELFMSPPKDMAKAAHGWPSPRSWHLLVRALAAAKASGAAPAVSRLLAYGCVGEGAGAEFTTYLTDLDLPDPARVLEAGDAYDFPTRDDKLFAVLGAVAHYAAREASEPTWSAAWGIMARAGKTKPDIAAASVRALAQAGLSKRELRLPLAELKPFAKLLKEAGL